jgi:nicotinamidase-related amidase
MKHALLIIDVQQALCSGAEAAFDIDRVVDRINAVSTKARVAGAPVFLIQHEETEGSLQYGTEVWQLYERLAVQPEDIGVRKTTPDSFPQDRTPVVAASQERREACRLRLTE